MFNGDWYTHTLILQPSEIAYLVVMLCWLLLKILSRGLFLNPEAAVSSVWDVIDWVIVLVRDC